MSFVKSVLFMATCGMLAALCVPVVAADWTRFRGPNGSGVSEDTAALPAEWSPTKNLQWKKELPGSGVSCPIIVGEKVFVTCYSGYGLDRREPGSIDNLKRHLVCLNRADGEILWNKTVASDASNEDEYSGMGVPEHGYASHTPVSDGTNVYVFFGKGGVLAFDMDGKQLWHANVGKESDFRRWGSSSSPIVLDELVVVPAGAESRAVVGLNKANGEELWRAEADAFGNVWGTPAVAKREDGDTDIVIGAPYEIWGINPATGKLRWYCEAMETDQFNSSVVVDSGKIFAIEGRGGGSIAIKTGGKGDVTATHVAWSGNHNSRFGSPVVFEGRLYFVADGVVNCVNAENGERIFQGRLPAAAGGDEQRGGQPPGRGGFGGGGRGGFGGGRGSDYASLVLGDGKLIYVTRSGEMHVVAATDTFEHLATNRVTADTEDFSATPAISNGQIFVRSNKFLYCIGK